MSRGGVSGFGFPKSVRLRRRSEFLRVQEQGIKVHGQGFLLAAMANGTDETRLGITVSSRVGNAVVRARLRRHLREVFRTRRREFPAGVDVVVIARSSAAAMRRTQLEREVGLLCAALHGKLR